MRLVRFEAGRTSWGVLEGTTIRQTAGPGQSPTGTWFELSQVKLLAPATPSKIVCVGRNYLDHIKELGNDANLPKEPGLFLKGPNTLANPANPELPESGDLVPYPSFTELLHYEGELALVIGKPMQQVPEAQALDHVLGYTCALDITARDKQKTDLQWVRAKSADKFCPLGPWLETKLDPQNVNLRTYINGQIRQNANTNQMIFSVAQILAYISSFMTLEAGDVVLTGTPEGVGELNKGDLIEVAVEGIGSLRTQVGKSS
jgi:2-keto-4-pentenoate hydratase/2-oxohepta-3-ene-1,7-dioic acid hydratase in catechol pathway